MEKKKIENPQDIEQAVEWLNPDIEIKITKPQLRGAWIFINNLYSKKVKQKRFECHQWFDKLWTNHKTRDELYDRLAKELGIPRTKCHFSTMSEDELDQALHFLKRWWKEKYDR